MTQKEKDLLLKDLCARLPYRVKCKLWSGNDEFNSVIEALKISGLDAFMCNNSFKVKPYLRPMSSMTEEEYLELRKITITSPNLQTAVVLFWEHHFDEEPHWRNDWTSCALPDVLDWLNEHQFDYRGLIEKGLALEATEGMYKF